jgi:hypothetical protein
MDAESTKYLIIHGISSVRENFSLDNDAIICLYSAMMNVMEINEVKAVIAFDPDITDCCVKAA